MRRLASLALLAASALPAQVNYERLVNALKEPQNWLTYWGDYTAVPHRDVKQINLANAWDLRVEWMFQTGMPGGGFETVPLAVDGIMYFTAGEGTAFAIDARSGRQLWRYKHACPPGRRVAGVNRGLAILGNLLYMVTIDSHLVALDAATGQPVWDTEMVPYKAGTYYATIAPLVVKDKVIAGIGGGEQGVRGLTHTTPRRASAPGASGPCRGRASPAPIPGPAIPGRSAAGPPG